MELHLPWPDQSWTQKQVLVNRERVRKERTDAVIKHSISFLWHSVLERDQGMGHQRQAPSWHVHHEGCCGSKQRWWRRRGNQSINVYYAIECFSLPSILLHFCSRTRLFDTNQFFSFSLFPHSVICRRCSSIETIQTKWCQERGRERRESFYVNYLIYIHEIIEREERVKTVTEPAAAALFTFSPPLFADKSIFMAS